MTAVRLLATGDRPELVARRLRVVTNLDDARIADLIKTTPVNLPDLLSLRSAEHVVDALRHAGADSQILIHGLLTDAQEHVDPPGDTVAERRGAR